MNTNKIIYRKGNHVIQVTELGEQACINGVNGLIDTIDLMFLLSSNGYVIVG